MKFLGRICGGFVLQGLSVLLSVTLFAPSGTIFWWTQSGVAIALMLHTPDDVWYERIVHVSSGVLSYILIRGHVFPAKLLLTTSASNAAGQFFGYKAMKHYVHVDITSLRFLAIFTVFPIILASLVAAIPGSIGFYLFLEGVTFLNVFIYYSIGHISGTTTILYPAIVIPTLWNHRKRFIPKEFTGLILISILCMPEEYFLFGFTAIVIVFSSMVWTNIYTDQFYSSVIGFLSTVVILGSTVGNRGPFYYIDNTSATDRVVIGTQVAVTALTLLGASIVMIFTKIRNLEKLERESRRQVEKRIEDQMVNLFRIGHDLNNNSTLVKGLCENMVGLNPNLKIVDAINTLNGVLVSDMIDTFRYGTDRKVTKERVDMADFIQTYITVGQGMAKLEGKNIAVTSETNSNEAIVVYTNKERLHQIMCNLVGNAVKYTESGTIKITVSVTENYLHLDVKDTGIGISRENLPKVFDPFFRCDRATKVNSGTGVGLANAKKICDMIGADVTVSSAGEGMGSTFTIILERKFHTETKRNFSLRVMAIDDSEIIRKLIHRYISGIGCDVVLKASVMEARFYLETNTSDPFDLIVTDQMIGKDLGTEFIKEIRLGNVKGTRRDIPCVLCSGENSTNDQDRRTIFMGKPFSRSDIFATLDEVVRVMATQNL